jgi:hypothetical protein
MLASTFLPIPLPTSYCARHSHAQQKMLSLSLSLGGACVSTPLDSHCCLHETSQDEDDASVGGTARRTPENVLVAAVVVDDRK